MNPVLLALRAFHSTGVNLLPESPMVARDAAPRRDDLPRRVVARKGSSPLHHRLRTAIASSIRRVLAFQFYKVCSTGKPPKTRT
jgi:hypothetical protein